MIAPVSRPAFAARRNIRVMIVDDSVVARGLFSAWIGAAADCEVVGALRTGRDAVEQVGHLDPDVVILDIDMPDMDGITALPLLLRKKPDLSVIMASTLTRRNAEISLRALALGAADYVPKPETARETTTSLPFRHELIDKVRYLGARSRAVRPATVSRPRILAPLRGRDDGQMAASPVSGPASAPPFRLRGVSCVPPRVVLIGCSTGGPQALSTLIPAIGPALERAPVLITQHMPATFTTILAEHLQRSSGRPVREAIDGEPIKAGTVYLAPGGRHLRIVRGAEGPVAALDDGPPVHFCKPSVDPMFTSGAAVWGAGALGVVLTGMGSDGAQGSEAIAAAGGTMIAQDEATSVIWGMPAQTIATGSCSAVLPLDGIAETVVRLFRGQSA